MTFHSTEQSSFHNISYSTTSTKMAIPYLKTTLDCVDFDKTVLPYVYQFYDLPEKALNVLQGRQSPLAFYTTTNPLIFGLELSLALAPGKTS